MFKKCAKNIQKGIDKAKMMCYNDSTKSKRKGKK
jgi:hypothetical protein